MPFFLSQSPPLILSLTPFSPLIPQFPLQSIHHQSPSGNHKQEKEKKKEKKKNNHRKEENFYTSKAVPGKSISAPSLTLNSPTRNPTKTTAQPQNLNPPGKSIRNKEAHPDSGIGNGPNGRAPKEQDEQIVDFFWKTGRLPTREEVQDIISDENGRVPGKDEVEIFDSFKRFRKSPAHEEIVDLDLKEIGRTPTKGVEIAGFDDKNGGLVSQGVESLSFGESGRTPCPCIDGLESSDFEVKNVKIGGNERIPMKDRTKIFHSFRENGRTPTEKIAYSCSDEGNGRPCVEVIGFVEKISRVTIQEQEENSDYVGRIGKLRLLDIVERIQSLQSGERIDIRHFFRSNGDIPTAVDINNLLIAILKADKPDYAAVVFNELSSCGISPDIRTFSIMIQCYCKKNDPDEARRVLDSMIENGYSPNVITFTILINCFCKRGRLQKAFEIFDIMHRVGCEPNIQTYNCLINGLCYVGRVEEANELLTKIKNSSKKPDIFTFTVVMDGFCKVGRANEGKELLEDAIRMGLQPTAVTFNALFNGYCKEGRPLEGINLLKQMKEMGSQPDFISYSTLLHGLLIWDEISAALQIYKEMSGDGFEADNRMMNTLLRGVCQNLSADGDMLNDAEELFQRMKETECCPTPYTYCLMIQSLSSSGQTVKALSSLHEMLGIGYRPRTTTYNAVIRALCSEGRANEAWLLVVHMVQQRRFPSRDSYRLIFNEFYRQGRVLDACKVHALTVKQGIGIHGKSWENPVSMKKPLEMALER